METESVFQRIRRIFDQFNSDVEETRASQASSAEQIASVEYEFEQLKKLVAEHALAE